jgi:hypothetical protein
LKYLIADEQKSGKEYKGLGFNKIADDEYMHGKFLKGLYNKKWFDQ